MGDRSVAIGLRFIRDHANRPIGVVNVVRQVGGSRRALELRFQQVLGRSINRELPAARLERAKRLLIETDLPVVDVHGRRFQRLELPDPFLSPRAGPFAEGVSRPIEARVKRCFSSRSRTASLPRRGDRLAADGTSARSARAGRRAVGR